MQTSVDADAWRLAGHASNRWTTQTLGPEQKSMRPGYEIYFLHTRRKNLLKSFFPHVRRAVIYSQFIGDAIPATIDFSISRTIRSEFSALLPRIETSFFCGVLLLSYKWQKVRLFSSVVCWGRFPWLTFKAMILPRVTSISAQIWDGRGGRYVLKH